MSDPVDTITLRAFDERDIARLGDWWARDDVRPLQTDWPVPRPPETVREVFRTWGSNDPDGTSHALAVDVDGVLVGYVAVFGFRPPSRTGELAIMLGPEHQGRGIGRRAMTALMAVAFDDIDLHRVEVRVVAFNTRAIRLYASLGFVEEGRLRERVLHRGRRHDQVVMGLLRTEWAREGVRTRAV